MKLWCFLIIVNISAFWLAFLITVSFIEAPVKFRIKEMSKVAAIALGKKMFRILQWFEVAFIVVFLLCQFGTGLNINSLLTFALLLILLVQTVVLRPSLYKKANEVIEGRNDNEMKSKGHFTFIVTELIKVFLLITNIIITNNSIYKVAV